MIKLAGIFLIVSLSLQVAAQQIEIKKSRDIVVIKGQSYYLHVVDEGQTLYSISKAYGVEVDVIRKLNDKQDNSLTMFEILKIPYVEPYVQKDDTYYYHKVEKGETLYSISRKFGIKVKRILKDNEQYATTPLSIGAIVKLPVAEINMPQTEERENIPENKEEPEKEKETVAETGTDVPQKDSLNPEIPAFQEDMAIPDNKYVKVALLLPLFVHENLSLNGNPERMDTVTLRKTQLRILPKSEPFLAFYEGILLAVDSLKNAGYKIELHIFDTEKNTEKMYRITARINELNPDIIIGPVYGSEFRTLAANLINRNIPVVYPLSSRKENLRHYPNFIQVNPSFQTLTETMSNWIATQRDSAHIVCIRPGGESGMEEQLLETTEKKWFARSLDSLELIRFYKWDFEEEHLEALKLLLDPDTENIIVLPTSKEADVSKILPVLSALTDGYRITVVGFQDWQNFTSVDHETFYKLNVKLFTYSYMDNYSEEAGIFSDNYRTYFSTEPHTLAAKAYDMGLYFIPLAAEYGSNTLRAIGQTDKRGWFSAFRFRQLSPDGGWENQGVYIVNYGSDYKNRVSLPE